jgi:hypothetical protein
MPVTTAGLNHIAGAIIGEALTAFNAANAHLGVGDSSTAFSVGQTDLVAATNKFREAVDSAPGRAGAVLTFVATFETGDANFAWNEVGIFNASSSGTMLARVVSSLGTKASGDWTLTVTETLSLA